MLRREARNGDRWRGKRGVRFAKETGGSDLRLFPARLRRLRAFTPLPPAPPRSAEAARWPGAAPRAPAAPRRGPAPWPARPRAPPRPRPAAPERPPDPSAGVPPRPRGGTSRADVPRRGQETSDCEASGGRGRAGGVRGETRETDGVGGGTRNESTPGRGGGGGGGGKRQGRGRASAPALPSRTSARARSAAAGKAAPRAPPRARGRGSSSEGLARRPPPAPPSLPSPPAPGERLVVSAADALLFAASLEVREVVGEPKLVTDGFELGLGVDARAMQRLAVAVEDALEQRARRARKGRLELGVARGAQRVAQRLVVAVGQQTQPAAAHGRVRLERHGGGDASGEASRCEAPSAPRRVRARAPCGSTARAPVRARRAPSLPFPAPPPAARAPCLSPLPSRRPPRFPASPPPPSPRFPASPPALVLPPRSARGRPGRPIGARAGRRAVGRSVEGSRGGRVAPVRSGSRECSRPANRSSRAPLPGASPPVDRPRRSWPRARRRRRRSLRASRDRPCIAPVVPPVVRALFAMGQNQSSGGMNPGGNKDGDQVRGGSPAIGPSSRRGEGGGRSAAVGRDSF